MPDTAPAMRAVAFVDFGGPEVMQLVHLPVPHPGPRQARVRVHAATVNPTDTIFRSGLGYAARVGHPAPWVPGMDFAGVVESVGPGSRWAPGTRVFGVAMPSGSRRGAYADYVIAPDDALAQAPTAASHAQASTLGMNGLTALRALDLLRPHDLMTLGVTGAAGAVGGMVIQLARRLGLRIVADAAEQDEELVAELGADDVLLRGSGWPRAVTSLVPGGLDAVVDAGLYGTRVLGAVRDSGAAAVVREDHPTLPERGIVVHSIRMTDYYRNRERLEAIAVAAQAGDLSMRVARVLGPDEAREAHRLLAAGGIRGRLVIDFSDPSTQAST